MERRCSRRACLGVLLALAAQPRILYAAPSVPVVALLWVGGTGPSPYIAALTQGLRELGYVPGHSIRIEERFIVTDYKDLPNAAHKLVSEKPDVIVVYGATAAQALQKATATIPVVIAASSDPVKLGLVQSLARPGTNFTGLTGIASELSSKRLELLRQAFPSLRRVAVVLYPGSEAEILGLKAFEAAAKEMKIESRSVEVRSASEIAPAIASITKLEVQAIFFIGSSLFRAHASELVTETAKTRLPAMYADQLYADAGGLLSYGPTVADSFAQAATYVDKILKGARPEDLPVQQPTLIRLIVNTKTARTQGITLPSSLLLRADRLIE